MKLRKESQQRDAALFTEDKLEKQFITRKKVCAHNTLVNDFLLENRVFDFRT